MTEPEKKKKKLDDVTKPLSDSLKGLIKRYNARSSKQSVTGAQVKGNPFIEILEKYNDNDDEDDKTDYLRELENKGVNPYEVLNVSIRDKAIFIIFAMVARTVAYSVVDTSIQRNWFFMRSSSYDKRLKKAFALYAILYISIIVLAIIWVNGGSDYKRRISLNYLNFHSNRASAISHVVLVAVIYFMVYWMTGIINRNASSGKYAEYSIMYQVSKVTIIVQILVSLIIFSSFDLRV